MMDTQRFDEFVRDVRNMLVEAHTLRTVNDTVLGKFKETAEKYREVSTRLQAESAQKDAAYAERNLVVAALARVCAAQEAPRWFVGVGQHVGEDWEDDWRTILFIDTPEGQMSWHFHDSEKHLLDGLPEYLGDWDGHSTIEKYERLNRLWKLSPEPKAIIPCAHKNGFNNVRQQKYQPLNRTLYIGECVDCRSTTQVPPSDVKKYTQRTSTSCEHRQVRNVRLWDMRADGLDGEKILVGECTSCSSTVQVCSRCHLTRARHPYYNQPEEVCEDFVA